MEASRRTRIAQVVAIVLALALGTFTATALARDGADDSAGTAGTTGTTTTGTTGTTTEPGVTPLPGNRIRVVGFVTARDEAARTFTLKVKNRKPASASSRGHKHNRVTRTFTVLANELTIPAVGRQVLVKGAKVDAATIDATRVKVLRGDDNLNRGGRDDDGDDGDSGHGRGHDDDGDDDRRGRGHDDDHSRGRGHGGDDD
ncbi:MAG TPA: hypothetical protein VLK58_00275 [Conexibacter sp.]|nr:hypothetical protein [Conexibacter sp.]